MKTITQVSENVFKFDEVEVDFARRSKREPEATKDGFVYDGECRSKVVIDGVQYRHPIWRMWADMRSRTTSTAFQKRWPTYMGTSVCMEWRTFSTFEAWVLKQHDWLSRQLDKDILVPGNKIYGPEFCCLVPMAINSLLIACNTARGDLPLGVTINKSTGQLMAKCNDGSGVQIQKSFGHNHFDLESERSKEAAAEAHQWFQTTKADIIRAQVKALLHPRHDIRIMKRLIAIAARLDFNAKLASETLVY